MRCSSEWEPRAFHLLGLRRKLLLPNDSSLPTEQDLNQQPAVSIADASGWVLFAVEKGRNCRLRVSSGS